MRHDPLNMFYNMRNPPGCFRLPVKACRPQSQIGSIDRFTTVQGFAANHEQGRANLVKLSKEQRAFFTRAFWLLPCPKTAFSQEYFLGKFIVVLLTNAKSFSKNCGVLRTKISLICAPGFADMEPPHRVCSFPGYSTSTVTTPRIFVSRRCNRRPSGPSVCQ